MTKGQSMAKGQLLAKGQLQSPGALIALILIASAILTLKVSLRETAVTEEIINITSGYECVKFLKCESSFKTPLLAKISSAGLLTFKQLNFPEKKDYYLGAINEQQELEFGRKFIYGQRTTLGQRITHDSGNNSELIIGLARLSSIIVLLALIFWTYLWAKELNGKWWGVLPAFMLAFSPIFLSYGHYAIPNIVETISSFVFIYFLSRQFYNPSPKNILFSGIGFGLTQIASAKPIFFVVYLVFIGLIYCLISFNFTPLLSQNILKKIKSFFIKNWIYPTSMIAVFLIGLIIFLLLNFFFNSGYLWSKDNFKNSSVPEIISNISSRYLENYPENRLTFYSEQNAQYIERRTARYEPTYLFGKIYPEKPQFYFILLYLLKEPLPVLMIILAAILIGIKISFSDFLKRRLKLTDSLKINFSEFLMLSFIVLYPLWLWLSPTNDGIRQFMPVIPFIYLMTTNSLKKIKGVFRMVLISAFVLWLGAEVALAFPYYTSYFNQIGGGVNNGYKTAIGSNYDWGQDLKELKKFVETNKIEKIAIDYFGGVDPKYYLGEKAIKWSSPRMSPKESGIDWLAISLTSLQAAKAEIIDNAVKRNPEDEYQWLKNPYTPFSRAGKSIFIYKL